MTGSGGWEIAVGVVMSRPEGIIVVLGYLVAVDGILFLLSLAFLWEVAPYGEGMGYTFGDNQKASRRLRRLAEVYESETRDLLNAVRSECSSTRFELALDLGCGPGWPTHLIELTLSQKALSAWRLPRRMSLRPV